MPTVPFQQRLAIVPPAATPQTPTAQPIETLAQLQWLNSPLGPNDTLEVEAVTCGLLLSTSWFWGYLDGVNAFLELDAGDAIAQLTPTVTQRWDAINIDPPLGGYRMFSLWRIAESLPQSMLVGPSSQIALRISALINPDEYSRQLYSTRGVFGGGTKWRYIADNAGGAGAASVTVPVSAAATPLQPVLDSVDAKCTWAGAAGLSTALVRLTSTLGSFNNYLLGRLSTYNPGDSDALSEQDLNLSGELTEGFTIAFSAAAANFYETLEVQGHDEGTYDLEAHGVNENLADLSGNKVVLPGGFVSLIGTMTTS